MALTQLKTGAIADDAVTTDKLANAINTERTANTAKSTNATHTGEVTGSGALTITDNTVDEANLKVSNSPTNGYFLSAQSGNTGGLTWAAATSDLVDDTSPQLGGNLASNGNNINIADSTDGSTNRITVGSAGDLQIYHDGTDSQIVNATNDLILQSTGDDVVIKAEDDLLFYVQGGAEAAIVARNNGEVDLRYDGNVKLATTSTGIEVTARIDAESGNHLDLRTLSSHEIQFRTNDTLRFALDSSGHLIPYLNNTYDIGSSSNRWRNIYTNDLNLSNEGSSNDVDGTWGSYTIQEGAEDLFLVNRRNGKKYKFNLTEVS